MANFNMKEIVDRLTEIVFSQTDCSNFCDRTLVEDVLIAFDYELSSNSLLTDACTENRFLYDEMTDSIVDNVKRRVISESDINNS